GENLPARKLYVAGVPLALVAIYGHQRSLPTSLECFFHGAEVAWKIRVSVQNEERPFQKRQCLTNRARGPKTDGAIKGIFEFQTEGAAVARVVPDHPAKVTDAHDDTFNAVRP